MKSNTLTATKLRLVLVALLVLIVASHAIFTFFGQQFLRNNSKSVTEAVTHALSSKETVNQLEQAKDQLDAQKKTVERSKKLFAPADSHNYQRQVIEDVNTYAQLAGVTVKGYVFSENGAAPAAASGSTSGQGAAQKPQTTTESSGPANTQPVSVTVNLEGPIEYETFLKFIKLIQGNVTQFHIQTLSLSGGSGGSEAQAIEGGPQAAERGNIVDVPSLTMEVYTKK